MKLLPLAVLLVASVLARMAVAQVCPEPTVKAQVRVRKDYVVLRVHLALSKWDSLLYQPNEQSVLKISSPPALRMTAYRVAHLPRKEVSVTRSPPEYYFSNALNRKTRSRVIDIKFTGNTQNTSFGVATYVDQGDVADCYQAYTTIARPIADEPRGVDLSSKYYEYGLGERCLEATLVANGFSTASVASADACYVSCSVPYAAVVPFHFNYVASTGACYCCGSECTLVSDPLSTAYRVLIPATLAPTMMPTKAPTDRPTVMPTQNPTGRPTVMPTQNPTGRPTVMPTGRPTVMPTESPSGRPTTTPTGMPTVIPTAARRLRQLRATHKLIRDQGSEDKDDMKTTETPSTEATSTSETQSHDSASLPPAPLVLIARPLSGADGGRALGGRLVMVQMDDRFGNVQPMQMVSMNKAYAARHGYEHRMVRERVFVQDEDGYPIHVCAWWTKPFLAWEALANSAAEDVAAVMIMDTDAVVHQDSTRVESVLERYKDKSVIIARDPFYFSSEINAGVFLVRNNEPGRRILREWMSHYDPTRWARKTTGEWICEGCSEWGGKDFEQGAFNAYIYHNEHLRPHVAVVEDGSFASYWAGEGGFIKHFAGDMKQDVNRYLQERNATRKDVPAKQPCFVEDGCFKYREKWVY